MAVTLVSGNGLGLLDSSLFLLNRNERTGNYDTGSGESLYVNVANGNLVIQHRDTYMPSLGADFDLVRTYNSRGSSSDAARDGERWTLSTGVELTVIAGFPRPSFRVQYGDGTVFDYHWDSQRNLYVSTDGQGAFETIQDLGFTISGPRYILTTADQTKLSFDTFGKLLRSEDTNGVRMDYIYAFDRLVQVRDDTGHIINYDYDDGMLHRITDETGAVLVEYHYSFGGQLSEVIDRMGHRTRFFYNGAGLLERIELPFRQTVNGVQETYQQREIRIDYDSAPWSPGNPPVVGSITDAEGGVTTFDYDFDFDGFPLPSYDGGTTTVVDALGNRRSTSNAQDYIDWRVANGFYTTYNPLFLGNPSYRAQYNAIREAHSLTYTYNENGYIESLTDQAGYRTEYTYDSKDNLTKVIDRNGWAITRSDSTYYRALRAQLGYVDASGNGRLVANLSNTEKTALREAFSSVFRYDSRGNLLEAEDNNGSITAFTYTSFNKVASATSAMGRELTVSDSAEAQAKRVSLGYAALVANLSAANKAAIQALYTTNFSYDSKQNLIEERSPGGDITRYEYDTKGNLTRKIVFLDPADLTTPAKQQVTQYFYDGFGNNIEIVDAEGAHAFSQYDHFGNVTRFTDGRGGITTYTYDRDNRLLTTTDPEGHTTVNTYDAVGNRISVTDARGHTVLRVYDRNNRLITVVDRAAGEPARDRLTNYRYDVVGNQTSVTDAEGRVTNYVYNTRRQLVELLTPQVTGATGSPVRYESSFAYDGEGNKITITNNRGYATQFLFNEDGLVSRRTEPNGHITQYTYDANGNQLVIVAGLQLAANQRRVLRFAYDEEDQVIRETDAEGHESAYTYDAVGNVTSATDGNGHTTNFEYDRNNRRIREIRPEVVDPRTGLPTRYVTQHRYDANGNEVELTDENGHITRFSFDKDNRRVLVEDANGIKTVYGYDGNNNRTSVQIGVQATMDANQHVVVTDSSQAQLATFGYDEFNQLVSTTDSLGNTTRVTYDRVGNAKTQVDAEGRTTQLAYDALNRLQQTTDAAGGITTRRYDGNGNLASLTDANGDATTFSYDNVDRQVLQTDANGLSKQTTFDDFGNLLTETRAAGTAQARTTQFVYNLNNWILSQTDPAGVVQSFDYDAVGNRILVTDGGGNTTRTFYDALDRAVRVLDPLSFETRFEYDGVGNRIALIDSRGGRTRFEYDAGNRLLRTTDAAGFASEYRYDVRGNRIELRTGVGTPGMQTTAFEYDRENNLRRVVDAGGKVTEYDYDRVYNRVETTDANGNTSVTAFDALNRVIRVTDALGHVTAYTYDAASNRLSRTDGNGKVTQWVYDAASRVTREIGADGVETHYGYDLVGNRTSITNAANTAAAATVTFTFDANDRLVSQTDALGNAMSYAYDANGNRVAVTDAGGHTTHYAYDANKRVTRIEDPEGNVVQYRYDGNGNRTQVIDAHGFVTTSYFNEASQIIFQVDAQGYVTQWGYDGNGNATSQKLFMTPVASADPNVLPSPVPNARDQTVRFEHDGLNRVTARIDGEGYRTEYAYDGVGNRTEIRQFRDLAGTDVAVTRSYFDGASHEIARLSAEGYLTRFTYDDAGNVLTRTVFDQRATIVGGVPQPASGDVGRVSRFTYDAAYRVVSETSALGVVTRFEYDARGNRTSVTDAFGTADARTSTFTFDAANRVTSITDAKGVVTRYGLDADGNIVDEYMAHGTSAQRLTHREYDGNHRLIRETSAIGVVTENHYDASGNLTSRVAAVGTPDQRTETFEYDRNNRLVAQVNAQGERSESAYDGAGNRIRLTLAPGLAAERVNTFEFDRDNRLAAAVDGEGVRTQYRYDGAGNKIETIQAQGVAGQERHSHYVYDDDNRMVRITDPVGGVTSYEYDVLGNQTRIVNANGGVQINTFDALGRLLTSLSAGGTLTVNTYDLRGNVLSTTQSFANGSDARTTRYTYDLVDQQITVTDGEGYTATIQYDAFGNQTSVTTGQYLVSGSDPAYDTTKAARAHVQTSSFTFDAADRVLSMADGEGNITTYSYDAVGNRTSVTEASNTAPRTTLYRYDLANRLVETITPEGGITRSDYDAAGNMVAEHVLQSVNGGANLWIDTHFEYDGNARLTANVDPYGVRTEYELDALGNVMAVRSAAGTADERVVRMEYDLNNRKTADVDGEGNRTAYVYDSLGNRVRVIDALGRVARYYFDGANRLIAVLDPQGGLNRFTYDSAGNNIERRLYAGRYTGPVSDTVAPSPAGSPEDRILHTAYDRAGRAITIIEADGSTTQKTYDGAGNLLSERLYANTSAPRTRTYSYDLNNRLEVFTDVDGTLTYFTWDGANNKTSERIVSATDPNAVRETQFTYDLNNRMVSKTFDPDGLNLLETSRYDKVGNVISSTDANGHAKTFAYDLANRLTSETNALGHVTQYGYDAVGNRTSVTDARNITRVFVYDDNNRIVEERGPTVEVFTIGSPVAQQELVTRHVFDAFGNEVQTIDPMGYRTTRYFDANGRMTAQLSADNALTQWQYNPFGEAVSETLYMTRLSDAAHNPDTTPAAPGGESRTKETTYDTMGRVTRTLHPAIDVTTVTLVNGAPVTTVTHTRPEERAIYDAFGNAVETFDKNGNRSVGYYDVNGRLLAQVDPEGYLTEWDYDAQDNVLEQRVYATPLDLASVSPGSRPAAPAGEVHTVSRRYDAANRLTQEYTPFVDVLDSTGAQSFERVLTTYTYDKVGNQTSRTRAAGTSEANSEYYYFDAANRRVAIINANRVVHTYTFDANGNITEQKRYFNAVGTGVNLATLDGDTVDFESLVFGNANDQTTVRSWDDANRLTSEVDLMSADGGADDIAKLSRYNANGQQTWAVQGDPLYATQFDYDRVGRVTRNIAPDGTGSRIEYDAAGNQRVLYTGQIDSTPQPATGITAAFGSNLVIGWTVPSGTNARSWLVWDTASHANLADYASRSETLATWFSGRGELYIPADAFGTGDQIYFRVVTADSAGNMAFTGEQVVRIPPRLQEISVVRTGADSVRVVVDAAASATNLSIHYGAAGSLSNSLALTLQPDGTYAADLTGITNISELSYRIDWQDAAGNTYRTTEQTFRAVGDHVAVSTTASDTSVSNGSQSGFNVNLSTKVPGSFAAKLATVAASLQSLDNPSSGPIEAEVAGTANPDGTWTYSIVLGSSTRIIPAGNYRIVLTGVYAGASEIVAQSTVLDQFDITLGGTPISETRQSLSWEAPAIGTPASRGQLVIVDGQSVPTLRDPDSQQVTVLANVGAGNHTYDALYGERSGTDHTLAIDSTEITEEVPNPDPTLPPTINILGYDVGVSLTLDAAETAKVSGAVHLAWRPAGSGLAFANDVALTANGNQFTTTLDELDAGEYDLKVYYLDSNGNEVIVDWLRIDAETADLTRTGRSLTVLGSETGGSISVAAGALPVITAGLYSGPVADERNFLDLTPQETGQDGGVVGADGRNTGYFTENRYNALNQLIATNSDTGLWREFGVDANGNQVATYLYGVEGNNEVQDSYKLFDHRNRVTTEYGVATQVFGSSTAQRAVMSHGYDVFDNEVRTVDANGGVITREYNALGLLVRQRDQVFAVSEIFYDRLGNETLVRDPLYDASNPAAHTTRKFYDAAGRMIREVSGTGDVKEYVYDVFDRRTQIRLLGEHGPITHTMSYDNRDRLVSYADGEQLTTLFEYDKRDNRTGTRNARGYWTREEYDGLNRVVATRYLQNGVEITEQRQYDAYGNLIAQVDGAGRTQSTVYGEFGRKIAEIDAAGRELRYEYDDFGNIVREYRPVAQSYSNTGWNQDLIDQYGYWGYVELLQQWNLNEKFPDIRREYDAAGRLTRVQDLATGVSTVYTYDLNGNRKSEDVTGTGGHDRHLTYLYDAADQMTRWADSATGMHLNYRWDAAGNQKRVFTDTGYANGVNHWYDYDGANRVVQITNGEGGSIVSGYGYDDYGNRNIWNNAGVVVTYQFDDNGRVSAGAWNEGGASWTSTWTYDEVGNVRSYITRKNGSVETSTTSEYSENNLTLFTNSDDQQTFNTFDLGQRLTSVRMVTESSTNTFNYYYYADGREREIVGSGSKKASGTTTFTYDANDKQISINKSKGDGMDRAETLSFVYNNDGQILYRFHDEGKDNNVHNTEFQYANGNPVGERKNQNGTITELLDTGKYNLVQNLGEDFPSSTVTSVTVMDGDTLQAIAARVYGNPSLWFILAEANGLTGSEPLKAGTKLSVPNTVESGALTADAHVVYDESDIIGSTLPNLKTPKKKGCGSILMIIIVVVIAVVATILTAGLAGVVAGALFGTTLAAASTAVTIASFAIAGAVVGAAASIVQQGLFIALGYQESFSWKDVAAGAVAGAFTGAAQGVGKAVQAGKIISEIGTQYARVAAAALNVAGEASKQLISNGKITSWAGLAGAALMPTRDGLTGDVLLEGMGGLSPTTVNMVTPWLEAAETYFENGELTSADWVTAVGSTLSAAVKIDTTGQTDLQAAFSNIGKNLLIGGVMSAFDKDAGKNFLQNAIGQEVGNYIGGRLATATGLRDWAERANDLSTKEEVNAARALAALKRREAEVGLQVGVQFMAAPLSANGIGPFEGAASDPFKGRMLFASANAAGMSDVFTWQDLMLFQATGGELTEAQRASLGLSSGTVSVDDEKVAEIKKLITAFFGEMRSSIRENRMAAEAGTWYENALAGVGSVFVGIWDAAKGIGTLGWEGMKAYYGTLWDVVTLDKDGLNKRYDAAKLTAEKTLTALKDFPDKAAAAAELASDITNYMINNAEVRDHLMKEVKATYGEFSAEQLPYFIGMVIGEVAVAIGTAGVGTIASKVSQGTKAGRAALKLFEALGEAALGPKAFRSKFDKLAPDASALARAEREAVRDGVAAADARVLASRAASSDNLFDVLQGRNLAQLTKAEVGELGETISARFLRDNNYTDVFSVQNASGNGIDIVARSPDGRLSFFEVKASKVGDVKDLSLRQQNMETFIEDVLGQAAGGTGRYRNISADMQQQARSMLREYRADPLKVSGNIIGVDLYNQQLRVSPWRR